MPYLTFHKKSLFRIELIAYVTSECSVGPMSSLFKNKDDDFSDVIILVCLMRY